MNKEKMQDMTLENLCDLLVRSTNDLLKAIEEKDKATIEKRQQHVEIIQELIQSKKMKNSRQN